jgi:hypothetical protein
MPGSAAGGHAPSIAAAGIVVVDSSPVRNFVRAGAQRPFADFLGDRARLTVDVARELEEAAMSRAGLRMLLEVWPQHEPVDLPDHLKQKAADILGFIADDPRPSLQDLGEVTCVLLAQYLRDSGECADPVLLLDDVRHGKNLAAPRRLLVVDTPALIIEMVCASAISRTLGQMVWRATFSDRAKWAAFDERLREALGK